jgi:hypothetical protein
MASVSRGVDPTQLTSAGLAARADAAAGSPWLDAACALYDWMRAREFRGHDPHDALASPILARLSFGSRWLGVGWTQLGKRTPPVLRAALGVRPSENAKALGLVLAACVRLWRATGDAHWRREGAHHMARLAELGMHGPGTVGWGYPFTWANRDFVAPAGTPSGVATAFVGHALLDAADAWHEPVAAKLAERAARFVHRQLGRVPAGDGFAFSYTPIDTRVVHNANVLAASLLARVAARVETTPPDAAEDFAAAARVAARTTAAAQAPDGSWPYGVGRRNAWIDSFHTSYLLVALDQVRRHLEETSLDSAIDRGVVFWRDAFFHGPAIGLSPYRAYPIDQHAVAHGIVALGALGERVPDARGTAVRLGEWSLGRMRAPDGSFYYRRGAFVLRRARYMRWTQAWMLLALAALADWSMA